MVTIKEVDLKRQEGGEELKEWRERKSLSDCTMWEKNLFSTEEKINGKMIKKKGFPQKKGQQSLIFWCSLEGYFAHTDWIKRSSSEWRWVHEWGQVCTVSVSYWYLTKHSKIMCHKIPTSSFSHRWCVLSRGLRWSEPSSVDLSWDDSRIYNCPQVSWKWWSRVVSAGKVGLVLCGL